MSSDPFPSVIPSRVCAHCGEPLEGRPNKRYCNDACRLAAFNARGERETIRQAQEHAVADVERQLAGGAETVFVEGRAISREAAWAAAAGLRATWAIDGAVATARTLHEQGQWWVLVQVPLGEFPG